MKGHIKAAWPLSGLSLVLVVCFCCYFLGGLLRQPSDLVIVALCLCPTLLMAWTVLAFEKGDPVQVEGGDLLDIRQKLQMMLQLFIVGAFSTIPVRLLETSLNSMIDDIWSLVFVQETDKSSHNGLPLKVLSSSGVALTSSFVYDCLYMSTTSFVVAGLIEESAKLAIFLLVFHGEFLCAQTASFVRTLMQRFHDMAFARDASAPFSLPFCSNASIPSVPVQTSSSAKRRPYLSQLPARTIILYLSVAALGFSFAENLMYTEMKIPRTFYDKHVSSDSKALGLEVSDTKAVLHSPQKVGPEALMSAFAETKRVTMAQAERYRRTPVKTQKPALEMTIREEEASREGPQWDINHGEGLSQELIPKPHAKSRETVAEPPEEVNNEHLTDAVIEMRWKMMISLFRGVIDVPLHCLWAAMTALSVIGILFKRDISGTLGEGRHVQEISLGPERRASWASSLISMFKTFAILVLPAVLHHGGFDFLVVFFHVHAYPYDEYRSACAVIFSTSVWIFIVLGIIYFNKTYSWLEIDQRTPNETIFHFQLANLGDVDLAQLESVHEGEK